MLITVISDTFVDELINVVGDGHVHSNPSKASITLNGDIRHNTGDEISLPDSPAVTKMGDTSLLTASLSNSNRLLEEDSKIPKTDPAADEDKPDIQNSESVSVAASAKTSEEVTQTGIIATEDGNNQSVPVTETEVQTFPEPSVITDQVPTLSTPVEPVLNTDQITSDADSHTSENGLIPVVQVNGIDTGSSEPLHINTTSSDELVAGSATSTASATTPVSPPMSPSKKKGFWSRLSIIFKPWKWRRRKRSKHLEAKAVGRCFLVNKK